MFLRFTSRTNADGGVVRYVALAHNRRVDGRIRPDVLMNLGRVDQVDVAGLRRLAASISKHFGDGDGLTERLSDAAETGAVAGAGPLEVVDARTIGSIWLLDQLWQRLQSTTNLVHNAIVHNLSGRGVVWVTTSVGPDAVVLTVENTGALTPQSVSTLVEPLQRGTGRARTDHAGVGLGLAIVKSITEAHDGTLTLTARADGGSVWRCDCQSRHRTRCARRRAADQSGRHVAAPATVPATAVRRGPAAVAPARRPSRKFGTGPPPRYARYSTGGHRPRTT